MQSALFRFLTLIVTVLSVASLRADDDIARQGFAFVKKYCYDCHGVRNNGNPLFNVLDRNGLIEQKYVVPGEPVEESFLWSRIESGDMPLEDAPQPSPAEKELIKAWIAAGAPNPQREHKPRALTGEADVVKEILKDLRTFSVKEARFQRYLTLHHLSNDPAVSEFDLRLYRAALSKAVNSLTLADKIILPLAIDKAQTVFRIDLRELQWDKGKLWSKLLKEYPYGLRFDTRAIADEFQRNAEQLRNTYDVDLFYVRGDWFAISATRGELYDLFLDIPATAAQLEERLGVDVEANFLASPARLHRAGFDESGVSSGARVVERHPFPNGGYYWKSYDFAPNNPSSILSWFALGPKFDDNRFGQRFGFEPDGGEIIFSLPNGMQGYMLVDAEGKKIQAGPIQVVRDLNETSGTPEVVNGISCMHCHRHGMIRFEDSVRLSLGLGGDPKKKALELYSPADQMRQLVKRDSERFLDALDTATRPFLRLGEDDEKKPIDRFAEPIGAVARLYQRDISLENAAMELGISPEKLKQGIELREELQFYGLGPLANGRKINRAFWENRRDVLSPFQHAARLLKLGTPISF